VIAIEVAGQKSYTCHYGVTSASLWPQFSFCSIIGADFSLRNSNYISKFLVRHEEHSKITTLWFWFLAKVEVIPLEIFIQFPNLNGFSISSSNIPILKKNLFKEEFKCLQYLQLSNNGIKLIEERTFYHLQELKWINLSHNRIEVVQFLIFQWNPKLIYINFSSNKIKAIIPNLFDNLKGLIYVDFEQNVCVNDGFQKSTSTLTNMREELANCFEICLTDTYCVYNILPTKIPQLQLLQ
jgi:hypothetical protein